MSQEPSQMILLRNEMDTDQSRLPALNTLSAQTKAYLQAATSANTRRAYQSDVRHFIAWGGLLPTTPDIIVRYLTEQAPRLNARTLVRRLTALKHWHTYQGFADPTQHPLIRKTLSGIKQLHGKPKEKALPLTLADLQIMMALLKGSPRLMDSRHSALVQLAFFGAFRRQELAGIQVEHVRFVTEGIEILIPHSKTDQAGEGQVCAIPYGDDCLCPVTALQTWLDQAQIKRGYIFRRLTKKGEILEKGIQPGQVNLIVQSLARQAGLVDWQHYSSHSFRRGFATEASKRGAPFGAIKRQGRWRHDGTVLGYIEEGKLFETNAAGILLGATNKLS